MLQAERFTVRCLRSITSVDVGYYKCCGCSTLEGLLCRVYRVLTSCWTCLQTWAFIERSAGDQERAAQLMKASTDLPGARPATLDCAARFFTDVRAPGAKRTARKLYERALQRDPNHAPSLQVTSRVLRSSMCADDPVM